MLMPIQDAMEGPWIFQLSLMFTLIAALGWLALALGNDYAHFRHGLLDMQRARTVCLMVRAPGLTMAVARLIDRALALALTLTLLPN